MAMRETAIDGTLFKFYDPDEVKREFVPLRDRIFDTAGGGVSERAPKIFLIGDWIKVIVRGSLIGSNRSQPPKEPDESVEDWMSDDPRDELQPLFDILFEDGIDEVLHMTPHVTADLIDTVGTRPTQARTWQRFSHSTAFRDDDRLLFDRTGRWGFYASVEEFGLLGGEPGFMSRYIEKVGGMNFIREKADDFWQYVLDENDWEAPLVGHYYELAGWDNPPQKKTG